MCVCMYIFIYTHTHIYIYIYIYIFEYMIVDDSTLQYVITRWHEGDGMVLRFRSTRRYQRSLNKSVPAWALKPETFKP